MSSASSFHVIRSIPYVGGPRGCRCPMTRRHPMSASALRLAVPLHSLSYRCVSVRIHCTSRLGTAMPSLFHPPLVHSFPCQSQRVLSFSILVPATPVLSVSSRVEAPLYESYPSRFSALQHAAFLFHLAALPVLPVVPYLRIVGHVVSPRFRLLPTRSGPCRCCAIGTGRAGHRSPATRARSPRPWGSSRGC